MSRNLFWLTDEQWAKIAPLLPTDVRDKARVDDRRVISGILDVLKSGCRWCDCPADYGPTTTIYNRFVRWAKRGVWERMFQELSRRGRSTETQMIDSTHVKAHRAAAGAKATVWAVKHRFAFLWSDKARGASRLALRTTAFGDFGLDPPRPLPARVLIGSTPSFMRFAMGFLSE
jgi:transposase